MKKKFVAPAIREEASLTQLTLVAIGLSGSLDNI